MVHISDSISKMGGMASSLGLDTSTCRINAPCKHDCYACKGRYNFANVQNSLKNNTASWYADPFDFEKRILDKCMCVKWFRWFHSGDIIDVDFLDMMYDVANLRADTRFLAFTKKFELVNEFIERNGRLPNLNIVLSAWGKWIPENPHNLPMAYVRLKSGVGKELIPKTAKECNGSCANCILNCDGGCWKLKDGESVVFNQH